MLAPAQLRLIISMVIRLVLAWILALVAIPVYAADVDGFRVWTDPEKTRAVLDLDKHAKYQLFTLDNPPRVVIDLKKSSLDTRKTARPFQDRWEYSRPRGFGLGSHHRLGRSRL